MPTTTTTTTKNGSRSDHGRQAPDTDVEPEVARRLVVELTKKGAMDLAWLVNEEQSNKTTLVNRAVQVYKLIAEAQANGKRLAITDPDGKNGELLYIL